jgi:type I restriction enzyme S subunit
VSVVENDEAALPEGWSQARLENLVYIAGRIGWRGLKASEYTEIGPLLVSVHSLNCGERVDFSAANHISQARYDESPEIKIQENDVLLTKDGAGIGKLGIVEGLSGPATVNSSLLVVRALQAFIPRFLYYFLRGPKMQELVQSRITGSATPHLFQKDIKLFDLMIPPLAEQKRIVAKVEELLARVNAARERLARVPALLKRFRQSVLAAACSGELTAEWRERHADVATGCEVVSRIGKRRNQPPPVPTIPRPSDQPTSWGWTTFGFAISELRNGISTRPALAPPGRPILRISAVRGGKVLLDDARFLPDSDSLLDMYSLQNGDLLFTRYNGSIDLLGVCGMVRGVKARSVLYPDKLMRVRFDHDHVTPAFAEVFFQSPEARERLTAEAKSSAGQQGVSGQSIKGQAFAIPPTEEQHEIVRRVDALFALADKIEARAGAATARVEKITQAILAKAFRGELVPTEAELARQENRPYEPASALLARIRAERETAGAVCQAKSKSPKGNVSRAAATQKIR